MRASIRIAWRGAAQICLQVLPDGRMTTQKHLQFVPSVMGVSRFRTLFLQSAFITHFGGHACHFSPICCNSHKMWKFTFAELWAKHGNSKLERVGSTTRHPCSSLGANISVKATNDRGKDLLKGCISSILLRLEGIWKI